MSEKEVVTKQKRLNPEEISEVRRKWAAGNHTLAQLSKEFGISIVAIHNQLKKAGIEKGSAKKLHKDVTSFAVSQELATEVLDVAAENAREWAKENKQMIGFLHLFNNVNIKLFADATKDKKAYLALAGEWKALSLLLKNRQNGYAALKEAYGVDNMTPDEDELPGLFISEMSELDIEEMRDDQRRELAESMGEIYTADENDIVDE